MLWIAALKNFADSCAPAHADWAALRLCLPQSKPAYSPHAWPLGHASGWAVGASAHDIVLESLGAMIINDVQGFLLATGSPPDVFSLP